MPCKHLSEIEKAMVALSVQRAETNTWVQLPSATKRYREFMIYHWKTWNEYDYRLRYNIGSSKGKNHIAHVYSKNQEYKTSRGVRRGLLEFLGLKAVKKGW